MGREKEIQEDRKIAGAKGAVRGRTPEVGTGGRWGKGGGRNTMNILCS